MKIRTADGYVYSKKTLKMEGMIICRTAVKNLLIARRYAKPKITEHHHLMGRKMFVASILWCLSSEEVKEECRQKVRYLKRYCRKNREKIKYYSAVSVFRQMIEEFLDENIEVLDRIEIIERYRGRGEMIGFE